MIKQARLREEKEFVLLDFESTAMVNGISFTFIALYEPKIYRKHFKH